MKFIPPPKKRINSIEFGVAIHLIGAAKLNPSVVDLTSRAKSVRAKRLLPEKLLSPKACFT